MLEVVPRAWSKPDFPGTLVVTKHLPAGSRKVSANRERGGAAPGALSRGSPASQSPGPDIG